MGAAAGALLLNETVSAENTPGTQVADKTSSIRVTALRTFWVASIVYIKLETNHGISGWGEIKGVDPRVAQPLVKSLFELLEGENPTRIEYLWQKIFRAERYARGGAFMVHTLAAIDMAEVLGQSGMERGRDQTPATRVAKSARNSSEISCCRKRASSGETGV